MKAETYGMSVPRAPDGRERHRPSERRHGRRPVGRNRASKQEICLYRNGFRRLKDGRWVYLDVESDPLVGYEVSGADRRWQLAAAARLSRLNVALTVASVGALAFLAIGLVFGVIDVPLKQDPALRLLYGLAEWFKEVETRAWDSWGSTLLIVLLVTAVYGPKILIAIVEEKFSRFDRAWKSRARQISLSQHTREVTRPARRKGMMLWGIPFSIALAAYSVGMLVSAWTDLFPLWLQSYFPLQVKGAFLSFAIAAAMFAMSFRIPKSARTERAREIKEEEFCDPDFIISTDGSKAGFWRTIWMAWLGTTNLNPVLIVFALVGLAVFSSVSDEQHRQSAERSIDPSAALEHFKATALVPPREITPPRKWRGPVRVSVQGAVGRGLGILSWTPGFLLDFQDATGLVFDLAPLDAPRADIIVRITDEPMDKDAKPNWTVQYSVDRSGPWNASGWVVIYAKRIAKLAGDDPKIRRRLATAALAWGLLRVLGLEGQPSPNTSPRDTIFGEAARHTALDMVALRILYDPSIIPGMGAEQATAEAQKFLARRFATLDRG